MHVMRNTKPATNPYQIVHQSNMMLVHTAQTKLTALHCSLDRYHSSQISLLATAQLIQEQQTKEQTQAYRTPKSQASKQTRQSGDKLSDRSMDSRADGKLPLAHRACIRDTPRKRGPISVPASHTQA